MSSFIINVNTVFEIDSERDSIEMTCPAQYDYSPDCVVVNYDEYGEDGAQVHTCLTVSGNTVEVKRSGSVQLCLLLREGMSGSERYDLGQNMILIDYYTDVVKTELDEEGGTIKLSYRIDFGGTVTKNTILLSVKKLADK
ncbi:MAG: DUF1934 domain-containing protein [Clostridia bacterium]|nr:DUF1934 domain-containing protein [Clostridia bacterium]